MKKLGIISMRAGTYHFPVEVSRWVVRETAKAGIERAMALALVAGLE
jgi:hypothetical protein